jgi:hypothetical protein
MSFWLLGPFLYIKYEQLIKYLFDSSLTIMSHAKVLFELLNDLKQQLVKELIRQYRIRSVVFLVHIAWPSTNLVRRSECPQIGEIGGAQVKSVVPRCVVCDIGRYRHCRLWNPSKSKCK